MKNEKLPNYYSVGGRGKIGVTSEEVVSGEKFHEVAMYYLINLPETEKEFECLSITENGAKETLHWINIDTLSEVQAYPEFLASELPHLPQSLKYLVERQG